MLLTYVGATTGTMIMFWLNPITHSCFSVSLLTLAHQFLRNCLPSSFQALRECLCLKLRRFPVFVCFVRDAAMRAYPSQVSSLLTYFTRHGGPAVCLLARPDLSLVGDSLFASELRLLLHCFSSRPLVSGRGPGCVYNLLVFGVWPHCLTYWPSAGSDHP